MPVEEASFASYGILEGAIRRLRENVLTVSRVANLALLAKTLASEENWPSCQRGVKIPIVKDSPPLAGTYGW